MPASISTHASLLLKAASSLPSRLHHHRTRKSFPNRIHLPAPASPNVVACRRRPPAIAASAVASRWWTRPGSVAGARSLASGLGGGQRKVEEEAMGSEATRVRRCGGEDRNMAVDGIGKASLLTLPTVLTIGRVAAVPLLVSTFYMDNAWAATMTTSIFLAAAITDWLDGYIARKMRLGTAFGAFLDPVADKLMVAATLVLLCTRPLETSLLGDGPWLLTVPSITIIGREITMSAVREWAASQNSKVLEAVAVNNLGKWKTATQMTALTLLLASRDPSVAGQSALVASGVALLYVSAGLAIWSLVVYMRKIWRILLK